MLRPTFIRGSPQSQPNIRRIYTNPDPVMAEFLCVFRECISTLALDSIYINHTTHLKMLRVCALSFARDSVCCVLGQSRRYRREGCTMRAMTLSPGRSSNMSRRRLTCMQPQVGRAKVYIYIPVEHTHKKKVEKMRLTDRGDEMD